MTQNLTLSSIMMKNQELKMVMAFRTTPNSSNPFLQVEPCATPASSRCEAPESSRSVTPNVHNTKPGGTNRSYWWNHFILVTVNGEQLRQCNHCDVSYKHTGGTRNMALHMHREHDNKVQLSQQIIDSHFGLRFRV